MPSTMTISRVKFIRLSFTALCGFGLASSAISLARADCVNNVASNDVLWIRNQPNPHAKQVGSIPSDGCGVTIGRCIGSGWCSVGYHGVMGWVNGNYLSKATATPAPQGGNRNTSVTQQQQVIKQNQTTIIINPSNSQ